MSMEKLELANTCMRRDTVGARSAVMALILGLASASNEEEAKATAREILKGKKVALEHLEEGIKMASWPDDWLQARLNTIRKNNFR